MGWPLNTVESLGRLLVVEPKAQLVEGGLVGVFAHDVFLIDAPWPVRSGIGDESLMNPTG